MFLVFFHLLAYSESHNTDVETETVILEEKGLCEELNLTKSRVRILGQQEHELGHRSCRCWERAEMTGTNPITYSVWMNRDHLDSLAFTKIKRVSCISLPDNVPLNVTFSLKI
jgi:hypothetical protein